MINTAATNGDAIYFDLVDEVLGGLGGFGLSAETAISSIFASKLSCHPSWIV